MKHCYGISIKYNDYAVVSCASDIHSGLSAHLSTSKHGTLYLKITCKIDREEHYFHLKTIRPGDRLVIGFDEVRNPGLMNMGLLGSYERRIKDYQLEDAKRFGVNVITDNGKLIRCSHPLEGNFYLICANVHFHHARAFVMAGNKDVNWKWQFENLYPGKNIKLNIVETNWCNFPRIIKHHSSHH